MKILDKNTGEWKTIQLGGGTIDYDNLPVGSIIDYDGDEVPVGYELSEDGADGGTWIGDDTPTNAYNLWIEPSKEINSATEVVNSLGGNETNLAPSVKVLNDAINYSTSETDTGAKWIDGKTIYRKIVTFTLPSANPNTKIIETGMIPTKYTIIKMFGIAQNNTQILQIPQSSTNVVSENIQIYIDSAGNVICRVGNDRSAYSGILILEYTKK